MSTPANKVFNHVMAKLSLKNDVALSGVIGISTPTISKIRHGNQKMSDGVLLKMHEKTGISIAELRAKLAGESGAE